MLEELITTAESGNKSVNSLPVDFSLSFCSMSVAHVDMELDGCLVRHHQVPLRPPKDRRVFPTAIQ